MPPAKITPAELARQASIDPKLIRYYFGDTSALMTEVIMQIGQELSSRRAVQKDGPVSFRDRLHARIKALIEILSENPHLHEMLLERVVYGEAADDKQIAQLREEYMVRTASELQQLIDAAVRSGEIRKVDARYLYIAIIGMCEYPVNAFPMFSLLFGNGASKAGVLDGYADFLTELIYAGLATRPTSRRKL